MTFQNPDALVKNLDAYFLTNHDWETFAPTVIQGVSVSRTVTYARYIVLANTVIIQAELLITSAGTGGSVIQIGGFPTAILPANGPSLVSVVGIGSILDIGVAFYVGAMIYNTATLFTFISHNNANYIGSQPNFALASTDQLSFQASYER